jgi:hypothetical protein
MAFTWRVRHWLAGAVANWLDGRTRLERSRILGDGHVWVFGVIGAREARRV